MAGFAERKDKEFNIGKCELYDNVNDLYNTNKLEDLSVSKAIIEYMDTSEEESALISMDATNLDKKPYTHLEIHPSLILGVMGNQVVFPENNQLPRDLFACGQMRQAEEEISQALVNNGLRGSATDQLCAGQLSHRSRSRHPYNIMITTRTRASLLSAFVLCIPFFLCGL